ncbi:MAG: hypothetical protein ABFR89_05340 [Actinomycetota bacterium]
MRRSLTAVVAALFVLLLALPVSGARFTDTTTNAGNTFAFGAPQPIRVTTYRVNFTDDYYTLRLNYELAENYFVLLRGSADVSGEVDADGEPIIIEPSAAADYVRVVGDPFGDPGGFTESNQLELGRFSDDGVWWGQVTVVESLDRHDTAGFRLLKAHKASVGGDRWSVSGSWTEEGQVALYGGSMGGGMTVNDPDHANGWARIWPEGGYIELDRAASNSPANFTIYEVEWGSEWTIQHVRVKGNAGGAGVDTPNEYDTAKLSTAVVRERTFVLAYGTTSDSAPGTGWEGQIYTLGNGHPINGEPNKAGDEAKSVAVSSEYRVKRDVEVYVHTHPRLRVDHRFDPHSSIPADTGSGSITVDSPLAGETYGVGTTGTLRFSILSNSSSGSDVTGSQPIIWSRHTQPTTVSWARHDITNAGASWLQSIDFGEIWR